MKFDENKYTEALALYRTITAKALAMWGTIVQDVAKLESPQDKELKLLDFICGTGKLSNHFSHIGFEFTALNRFSKMIEDFAKERAGGETEHIAGAIHDLDTNPRFDMLWISKVLHLMSSEK